MVMSHLCRILMVQIGRLVVAEGERKQMHAEIVVVNDE